MVISTVVFDLDGTLVDSDASLVQAMNAARGQLGLSALEDAVIRSHIGWGVASFVTRCIPEAAEASLALRTFREEYCRVLDGQQTPPCHGAAACLEALTKGPWRVGLATNKLERFARLILEQHGWHRFFERIVGGDTIGVMKPDPAVLRHFESLMPVTHAEALLLVGDSDVDEQTAAAYGCRFARVPSERFTTSPGPDTIVLRSLAELPAILQGQKP
jgi:phosphoglycolate phosphatase